MQKKGAGRIFNSKDGKLGLPLLVSIILVFALTIVFTEAMVVRLQTPGNLTFNTSTQRTINISFNATWNPEGTIGLENVSNCTLYVNSTMNNIAWAAQKTVDRDSMGIDNKLQNGSIGFSYMRFNFTGDGNFTYGIGCLNFTNSTPATALTFSGNFTVFIDASPPGFNFSELNVSIYNTSVVAQRVIQFKLNDSGLGINLSYNGSINVSITLGGTKIAFFNYTNSSAATNLTCSALSPPITTALITCNASFNFNSNGSYVINASAQDAMGTYGIATMNVIVDQIPPIITSLNFSNGTITQEASLGASTPATVPAAGKGTWAQGRRLFGIANVTDNLTRPVHAYLQFYNLTSASWITVNSTANKGELNISPSATNTNGTVNLSYVVPTGHNVFEGANISFRYLVNDTLGNINTSGNVINITIQINDTTKPTLEVRVGSES